VWYALTADGKKLGARVIAEAHKVINELFNCLSERDEKKFTDALRAMNDILIKVKESKE
jgi:DNA-binding MarR family transcriptional regulator